MLVGCVFLFSVHECVFFRKASVCWSVWESVLLCLSRCVCVCVYLLSLRVPPLLVSPQLLHLLVASPLLPLLLLPYLALTPLLL